MAGIGTMIFLTPVMGWSWPALAPIFLMGAGAMGFKLVLDSRREHGELTDALKHRIANEQTIQIAINDSIEHAVFEDIRRGDRMYFEKDGIVLGVIRDERNRMRITVTGPKGAAPKDLEKLGRQFAQEIAQLFAQDRVVSQLARLNFDVVEEGRNEQDEIVLKVRRWE